VLQRAAGEGEDDHAGSFGCRVTRVRMQVSGIIIARASAFRISLAGWILGSVVSLFALSLERSLWGLR
jgi:hypothetical protein